MNVLAYEFLQRSGYPAARRRCLVDVDIIERAIPEIRGRVQEHLVSLGFAVHEVDLVALAESCLVQQPRYRRAAWIAQAPQVVDCSLFVKWLYGQIGLDLPRTSQRQYLFPLGCDAEADGMQPGDLVFTRGIHNYRSGIGHVAMAVSTTHIIHAVGRNGHPDVVRRELLSQHVLEYHLVSVRRYIHARRAITVEAPPLWRDPPESSLAIEEDLFRRVHNHPEQLVTSVELTRRGA